MIMQIIGTAVAQNTLEDTPEVGADGINEEGEV
jgi:hypothetical protein